MCNCVKDRNSCVGRDAPYTTVFNLSAQRCKANYFKFNCFIGDKRCLLRWIGMGAIALILAGCSTVAEEVPPRHLEMQQQWVLPPGSVVSGRRIMGGLGDISVELGGNAIHAPYDGKVEPHDHDCYIYSSPEIPAYLFRLCGLDQTNLGDIRRGQVIGRGAVLQFSALRKQPSGQWAMVEPSVSMLESILAQP
jgi:hypothetical protein